MDSCRTCPHIMGDWGRKGVSAYAHAAGETRGRMGMGRRRNRHSGHVTGETLNGGRGLRRGRGFGGGKLNGIVSGGRRN